MWNSAVMNRVPEKRWGIEDNSNIIFLISQQNILCDPSLDLSRRDKDDDGSQNRFGWCH